MKNEKTKKRKQEEEKLQFTGWFLWKFSCMFEKQRLALTNYQEKKEKEQKGKEWKHKRKFHLGAILSLKCKDTNGKRDSQRKSGRERMKGNCCKVFCHILRWPKREQL